VTFALSSDSADNRNRKQLEWSEEMTNNDDEDDADTDQPTDPLKLSSASYSKETVQTVNLLDPKQIPYELIMRLLEYLCLEMDSSYAQAILIFLPGINEIRKLHDLIVDHNKLGNAQYYKIYPLHSTISSENQGAVFDIPPQGMRKIVLSTNIAETGVTIPDITCVIDTGKHREMRCVLHSA
jgi:ATP-dependent RNA helicase DHX29